MDKVSYYLDHEKERNNIAMRGYQKIKTKYNYDVAIQKLLEKCQITME